MISLNLWTSNPANRTETSRLKIVTSCHIVPLIFKFVCLKSSQPNSNSSFENLHFLSHRPPNFFEPFPRNLSQSTPAARKVCVDKIGSRPRGNLCVPKIRPGEPERRQTYGDIAISVRKSTSVLLSCFTRPGRGSLPNLPRHPE